MIKIFYRLQFCSLSRSLAATQCFGNIVGLLLQQTSLKQKDSQHFLEGSSASALLISTSSAPSSGGLVLTTALAVCC